MGKSAKIQWYINRLSLMDTAEIIHRITGLYKAELEKINQENIAKQSYIYEKLNNFYFDSQDIKGIQDYYSDNSDLCKNLMDRANRILKHRFSFFAMDNYYFGEKINWHVDYLNNKSCDLEFYADINYRDYNKMGDIKYIWEINRFQHLFPLSQAFLVTNDEKYASEIIDQIDNWIDENPYLKGINWTSSLELALRLISWSWALKSLEICNWQTGYEFKEKISNSIYLQADYIFNHLSAHSSANNHLIGEAAGIVFAGSLFDFGSESEKWKDKGFKILLDELEKQTFNDGLNKEQTLDYHCFVFDFYLLSFVLLEKNGVNIPERAYDKLCQMADVLTLFVDRQLNRANIGDGDDGYVVKLQEDDQKKVLKSIFNTAAVLFNRGDFKFSGGASLDEKTLWLLGSGSVDKYNKIEHFAPVLASKCLHESGYAILKDNNVHGIMDVGQLGYLAISAHGHADALSLMLNYKDQQFLIDPGTYAYHTKKEWRDYFRGTSAHNTVEIDGQNQSEIGGNFMWLKKADVSIEKAVFNQEYDYVRASHNGYIKQNIGVKHQRETFLVKNKFLIVIDKMLNQDRREHSYCLNWHLAKDCGSSVEQDCIRVQKGSDQIFLTTFCDFKVKTSVLKGSTNPISGWASEKFDVKFPVNTLKLSTATDSAIKFITLISFDSKLDNAVYLDNILSISHQGNVYSYDLSGHLQ